MILVTAWSLHCLVTVSLSGVLFDLFFFLSILKFYLFLATLHLCCFFAWTSSSCGERGYSPVAVCRLLVAVAYLAVEHRLEVHGLQ